MPSERERPRTAHLVCERCEGVPNVARIGDEAKIVCHCTHVDGDLDPVALDDMAVLPEPWEFAEEVTA